MNQEETKKERFVPSRLVTSIQDVLKARDEKLILYTLQYRDMIARAFCNMSIEHIDYLIKNKKLYYYDKEEHKQFKKRQENESL